MKIQKLKAAVAVATLAALSLGATAANAATANATARAKILRQITLANTSDLQFGTIVTGAAASTVAISSGGARTCGSGLVCSGATTAAGFTIGWGHSTFEEGAKIVRAANAKQYVLFHHDPDQNDADVDEKQRRAQELFPNSICAYEGLTIDV